MGNSNIGKKYLPIVFIALALSACNEDYIKASSKLSVDGTKVFQETSKYFAEVMAASYEHCRLAGLRAAIKKDDPADWADDQKRCLDSNKKQVEVLAGFKKVSDVLSSSYTKLGTISGDDQVASIQSDFKNIGSALKYKVKETGSDKFMSAADQLASAIARALQARGIKEFSSSVDGIPLALAKVLEEPSSSAALDDTLTLLGQDKVDTAEALAKLKLTASPSADGLKSYLTSMGITPASNLQSSTEIEIFSNYYINTKEERDSTVARARIALAKSIKEIAETTSRLAEGAKVTPGSAVDNAKEAISIIKDFVHGVQGTN